MTLPTRRNLNRREMLKGTVGTALVAAGAASAPHASAAGSANSSNAGQFAGRHVQTTTTVTFSATGDANIEQPVFQSLIDMFNNSQSAVRVEYQPFPEGGYEKAVAMLQADTVPDILRVDDDMMYLVGTSGKLHDLTPFYQDYSVENYFPFLFHELAVDGKLFAVPMNDSMWLWLYNKELFAEAGLTAPQSWADAWEWDTTVENFQKLVKKQGDFTEIFAAVVGHGEEMPFQAGVGHYNHSITKANFNHPRNIEAMTLAAKLQYEDQICLPPGAGTPLDLFNAGQLAITHSLHTNSVSISPDIEWDFAPQHKAKAYTFNAQGSRAFVLPKAGPAQNVDAAWAFFEWYLNSEEAQRLVLDGAWGIPPLKSVATVENLASTSWGEGRNVQLLIEGMDYAYPRISIPSTDAMATHWKGGAAREEVFLGARTPEEFCEQVQQLVQQELDKAIAAGWQYTPPPHSDIISPWTKWYYQGDAHADDPRIEAGLPADDPSV